MDIDKPLDDIISSNRKPRGGASGGGRGRGSGPRRSDRGGKDTPYAVSDLFLLQHSYSHLDV